MKTNYKTTFKCSGCVATATPHLNEVVGEGNWEVDLESPQKTLKVFNENVSDKEVQEAVKRSGYEAERV